MKVLSKKRFTPKMVKQLLKIGAELATANTHRATNCDKIVFNDSDFVNDLAVANMLLECGANAARECTSLQYIEDGYAPEPVLDEVDLKFYLKNRKKKFLKPKDK